ncbi:alpha/beta hydrolase [Macrococcoides bohemicum]|uniref:Alpha/beta hydrolase n=1 Tax=Macrococcoides bohemicum TaxID=1903056 RepID=A0A4R5Y007_9STAP|nr:MULTISPECIES: alpha/beta hydrolase [Macrococcus]ATD31998.1 2-succinyl-6-hydroxy-2,4-cyclohexadiene-1-carboxylate synthase [Macrococcus sp. IME1552]QRN49254.1 alpha/beta hydrolase [Macrococcus bohemicus]QYA43022.1 alpha/beta hydrolase [Macrococcus bohemicus]QYA45374.1 alpha/beta hydrolase [Macrococcus bohemicus]TDL37613.1 alpha/beta hydrolase [Macrococcus bohemicus]
MLYYKTYIKDESAPWITFIHGAGGSSTIWFKQIRYFRKEYNILLVDLRGHGKSTEVVWKKTDSFKTLAAEVIEVLDELHIESTHIIGMSLGTIVSQTIADKYPDRVRSLVLGGAIISLDVRTKFLLMIGRISKNFIPYMLLYKLFAYIIMPRKEHEESRLAFINEAKKMSQKQFVKWFSLTRLINPYLSHLQVSTKKIPTLFLMGDEDYLFIPPVQKVVDNYSNFDLEIIKHSGHVCNIDQPDVFNSLSQKFIATYS